MKEFEFKETSIIQEYTLVMGERYEVNWPAARTPGLYRTVMYTIAAILKNYKSKSKRIGFKLKDKNGEFKFGAILNYHAPEEGDNEDDDAGNYTLEFTFYEDDMTDLDAVYDNYSDIFIMCSNKYAHDIMNGKFCSAEYCNILFIEAINGETPGWDNMAESIGWDRILICSVLHDEDKYMQGRDMKSLSEELGYTDPAAFACDLYVKENGKVGIIVLSMAEEDVETIAKLPYSALISDSLYGGGNPHPRLFGSFPRFLRVFVRERGVLSYEEAVRKMTSMPAERMGLKERGVLAPGMIADVLVYRKEEFIDNADYSGRNGLATGMENVFISGTPVVRDGGIVNREQGEFLLRK